MKWKYFKITEFDDPTEPGSGVKMDINLIDKLDEIRGLCGFPFIITSGYRTPGHNKKVGGTKTSEHLTGQAVDIYVGNGSERYKIVRSALVCGIRRIGVKKDCIHLGISPTLPQEVIWTYDK